MTDTSYEYVLRFNLYETKKKASLEEVFIMPEEPKPEVPEVWLSQIGQPPKRDFSKYGNTANFQNGRGLAGYPLPGNNSHSTMISRRANLEELLNGDVYEDWWNNRSGMGAGNNTGSYPTGGNHSDPDHNVITDFDFFDAGMTPDNAIVLKEPGEMNGLEGLELEQDDPVGSRDNIDGRVYDRTSMVAEEFAKLSKSQKETLRLSWEVEGLDPDVVEAKLTGNTEGLSDIQEMEVEYGKHVSEAYEQILAYLDDVADCDEVLRRILSDTYDLLSEEARVKLAHEGIAGLD